MQTIRRAINRLDRKRLARIVPALIVALIAGGTLLQTVAAIASSEQPIPEVKEGSGYLLVGVDPRLDSAEIEEIFEKRSLRVVRSWPDQALVAVEPSPSLMSSASARAHTMQDLRGVPGVRYVEEDGPVEAAGMLSVILPNDPLLQQQWGLTRTHIFSAWEIAVGNPNVTVALIDSGFDVAHEDIDESSLWVNEIEAAGITGIDDDGNGLVDDLNGWDWVENDRITNDSFGHGTHVGGVLAASIDNGIGVAAMGRGFRVMPLRVLDNRGSGFISDLIDALAYARANQAQIVNLSLVLRFDSTPVREAVQETFAQGILIVAATGNFGNQVFWPAAYPEAMAVAATNQFDETPAFSNGGFETEIAGPGEDVLSTYLNGGYFLNDGTSMAVPHISAVAALIWSMRPDLSSEEIRALLRSTALDVNRATLPGSDNAIGAGLLDAHGALLAASAGLSLAVDFDPDRYIGVNEPLSIPLRLQAGEGKVASAGGVIHWSLDEQRGTLVSDRDGQATLELTAPSAGGGYTLNLQYGSVGQEVRIDVFAGPLTLVSEAKDSLSVDEGAPLAISVRDADGRLVDRSLTIDVKTDLGSFAGGAKQTQLELTGGQKTLWFYAGTRAGTATLLFEAAGNVHTTTIPIAAGPLDLLQGPSRLFAHPSADGEGFEVEIKLESSDRYGNPVDGDVAVRFYSLVGEFETLAVRPSAGRVQTVLRIPGFQRNDFPLWATVPGSAAIYRSTVIPVPYRRYLPFVGAGPE